MTASPVPSRRTSFTCPVVDYEPPPLPQAGVCPAPSSAALHRRRPLRPVRAATTPAGEPPPPRAAAVFADTALRRVLEVTDRRRPVPHLRRLIAPALFDAVAAVVTSSSAPAGTAVLRRVRLRSVDAGGGEATAAEVFGTYSRGGRVRAVAGRVELAGGRWMLTALQLG